MSEFQVPVVTGPKPEEQNRIPVPSLSMPKAPEQAQRGLSAVTEPDAVAKSDEQPGMPPKDSADAVVEAIETPIQAGAAAAVHEGMRETPVGRAGLAAEEQRDAVAVAKSEQPRPVVAPGLNPQELRRQDSP